MAQKRGVATTAAQQSARNTTSESGATSTPGHQFHAAAPASPSGPGSELRAALTVIKRRGWIIVSTLAATLLVAGLGVMLMPPVYTASATIRVLTAANQSVDYVSYDVLTYADRRINTYAKLAVSRPLLDELSRRLGRERPPAVSVDIPANTELLRLTVEDRDPVIAAVAANNLASIVSASIGSGDASKRRDSLAAQLSELEGLLAVGDSRRPSLIDQARRETYARLLERFQQSSAFAAQEGNSAVIVEPAVPSEGPAKPNRLVILGLGLLVGTVGGLGLGSFFERIDTRLFTASRIQQVTGLPILATIASASDERFGPFFPSSSAPAEALWGLRIHMTQRNGGAFPKSVLIASAEPGEGKSTVAANFARAAALSGQHVLLVDANLRRPSLDRILELPNDRGLTSVMAGATTLDRAIQSTSIAELNVLTSGTLPANPAQLFATSHITRLVGQMTAGFDLVVIDTAALSDATDAVLLAPLVESVVLVVAISHTHHESVAAACHELTCAAAPAMGVVTNRTVSLKRIRARSRSRPLSPLRWSFLRSAWRFALPRRPRPAPAGGGQRLTREPTDLRTDLRKAKARV